MQEKNKHILQQAIQQLPRYEPDTTLWIAIEAELDILEKENPLQEAISSLPAHHPPDFIWDNIGQKLDKEQKGKTKRLWIKRIAAVAAAAVLVLTSSQLFFSNSGKEVITISYSEQQTEEVLFIQDWNEDEDAFEMVMTICEDRNIVCELPEFKILQSELEELNAAREDLKTALEFYGTDPNLIAQLTGIEHERSDVLKKMIAKI